MQRQIKNIMAAASQQLTSDEAKLEVRLMLMHVLSVNHAWLITHADESINQHQYDAFQAMLVRRMNGEPIAYILGSREFFGLQFKVTPDTLIPRSDTETLVEAALAKTPVNQASDILDLGTGTGAVALAIAHNRPQSHVTAVDASEGALQVAKENVQSLAIKNTSLSLSDWFTAVQNKTFDIIVSNPPYIEDQDPHLSQGDLRFEPTSALASGSDGLDDISTIVSQALKHLKPNGWLMLEHGYNQAAAVAGLLKTAGFADVAHVKDLGDIERVTLGRRA